MAGKTDKSGENVMISEKELQKLIKKGEKKGSLTFAEINNAISDELESLDQIEDIVIQLKDLGIKLVDMEKKKKTDAKSAAGKAAAAKEDGKKSKKDLFSAKKEKTDIEFGAVTDPVKMYLKEMGMVTLPSGARGSSQRTKLS